MASNQVGRTDLTPIALAEFVLLMLSLRRLWYRGNHPCGDKLGNELDVHATRSFGLKSGVSDQSIYNSCV